MSVYWHRLMEEFINRYAQGMEHYYLPKADDAQAGPSVGGMVAPVRVRLSNGLYLTPREAQCMRLIREGHTMKETAASLKLSPRTVEYYLMRLKERWSCRSKKELLVLLEEGGFISGVDESGRPAD